jgi:hypothetical protein
MSKSVLAPKPGELKLETIVERLRTFPGFERLSPSTVWRWKNEQFKAPRAQLALSLLGGHPARTALRLSLPRVLWMLPAIALTWQRSEADARDRPYGCLQGAEVELDPVFTETGAEAIEHLQQGKAHVALAGRELGERLKHFPDCQPLCQISEAPLLGISPEQFTHIDELAQKVIGYLPGTVVDRKLEEIGDYWGIELKLRALHSPREFANALAKRALDAAVGWEPLISQIESALPKKKQCKIWSFKSLARRPEGVCSWVFVNTKTASPSGVRVFLECLLVSAKFFKEVSEMLGGTRIAKEVVAKLPTEQQLPPENLIRLLQECNFGVEQLNPETVLALWAREGNATPRGTK